VAQGELYIVSWWAIRNGIVYTIGQKMQWDTVKVKQINNTTTKLCNQLQQTPVKCIVHKFIITIIYLPWQIIWFTGLSYFILNLWPQEPFMHVDLICPISNGNTISIWRFNEIDVFIVSAESMKEVSTVYVYISWSCSVFSDALTIRSSWKADFSITLSN